MQKQPNLKKGIYCVINGLHFFWVLLAAKYGMRMILNGLKMISEKIE